MSVEKQIKETRNYKNILDDVCKILDKNSVKYTRTSQSEIVVNDRKKKEIKGFVLSLPNMTKESLTILLDIVETKKCTYIWKKLSA